MKSPVETRRSSSLPLSRKAYVVVGMHRSGTSALTRILSLAGASLPSALMAAGKDNPKGFWESTAIAQLNDEILDSVDSGWDDVFALRPRPFLANFDTAFLSRAVETLQADFGDANPIVLKDPRVSILVPFWARALREFGAEPHFVLAVRHPLEVAASLMARNQMPVAKSALVWASYMLAAERDTRDESRVFVGFDNLLADWRTQVDRIEAQTGVPLPRLTARVTSEIDAFLSDEDRHHRADSTGLDRRRDIPGWIGGVVEWLERAARDDIGDTGAMDRLAQNLLGAEETFGTVVADSRARLKAANRVIDGAEADLAQRKADIANLEKIVAEDRHAASQELQRRDRELAEERQRAGDEIARRDQLLEDERIKASTLLRDLEVQLEAVVHEKDTALAQARADNNALNDALTRLQADIEQKRAEVADLEKVIREHQEAAAAELARRDAEHDAERQQALAELERRDRFLNDERETAARLLRELEERLASEAAAFATELGRANGALDDALKRHEAELATLQHRLSTLDAEQQHAATEAQRLLQDAQAQAAEMDAQRQQAALERDMAMAVVQSERALSRAEIDRVEREIAELRALIDHERGLAQAEYDRRDGEIAGERVAARAEFDRLGALLTQAEGRAAALVAELEQRDAEITRLGEVAGALEAKAATLAVESERRDAEIVRLGSLAAQSEAKAGALVAEAEAALRLLGLERDRHEAQSAALLQDLALAQAEAAKAHSQAAAIEGRLSADNAQLKDALGALQANLAAAELARQQEAERLGSEVAALSRTLRDQERASDELRSLIATERTTAQSAFDRHASEIAGERAAVAAERLATAAMIADLERRMADRSRETIVLSHELEQLRQSTMWKALDPLRKMLAGNRGLALFGRRALKAAWWTVTLQLPRRLAAARSTSVALPAPGDPPAAPRAERPALMPAQINDSTSIPLVDSANGLPSRLPSADLSGLIRELRDEFGPDAPIGWLETHAGAFGLQFDPTGGKTPKLTLTDDEAMALADKVRAAASGWPPAPDNPDVSIVIPVYNQLAFTLGCIASLFQNATRYSFEIIVADDASTDQTAAILSAGLPRTRTVRQATNKGFIANANAGAAAARGRYIVMLNNDTITLPGWLDEIIAPLEQADVGMVGSKLLYPDGRLQEAGGIVWRDASAWNLGRLDQARRPEYSYRRDVDYVSGASIALRTETWRLLRGFDDWFDVAYGEDSDLAFRVRQIGLRTVLQPLSMIVHFEGVSAGTDTGEGMKAYQIGNARKLAERWAPVLQSHRPNAESPELEKERSVRKRVLVIDACTPEPDKDAGSLTCLELMRAFQHNGYKVTFIPEDNFLFMPTETRALQREGIEVIYWPFYGSVDDYLARTGHLYEAVVIFRVNTAAKHVPTVRKRCPQAKILFHTSDVHFIREEREATMAGDPAMAERARATRAKELGIIQSADLTILHSTYEAEILADVTPASRAYVFPWILDPKPRGLGAAGRKDLMFLGGYRHGPNVDAVKYFVADIWPRVRAQLPDARFRIVGSEAPSELRALDGQHGIVFVGHVPDLDDAFRTIRLSVAPIRYGAGIKGKVAMSLAYGIPTVATSVAAEGMGLSDGHDALISDDPAVFADKVVALYRDDALWTSLSDNGIAFVEQTYGSALGKTRVADMLAIVGIQENSPR